MATVLTHAALPVIARRLAAVPEGLQRRLAAVAAVCACLPDLDLLSYAFDVRTTDAWGHRGATHSLLAAAVLALVAAALLFPSERRSRPRFLRVFAFLFLATAAHGLVDTLTTGEVGVALFSPLWNGRVLAPIGLVPVTPLGVPEVLGRWGALTVFDEALFFVAPCWLLVQALLARRARAATAPAGGTVGAETASRSGPSDAPARPELTGTAPRRAAPDAAPGKPPRAGGAEASGGTATPLAAAEPLRTSGAEASYGTPGAKPPHGGGAEASGGTPGAEPPLGGGAAASGGTATPPAGAEAHPPTGRSPRLLAVIALAWLGTALAFRLALPELCGVRAERVVRPLTGDEDVAAIPVDGLPDGGLVTRWEELQRLGLLGRTLEPRTRPWASSFFPYVYGGEAGRWRDGNLTLLWRTAVGVPEPGPPDARRWLDASPAERAVLSPVEKYDLAVGDDSFAATRLSLGRTHDARPRPRYWFGLCNGAAAASLAWPEPFRTVDVTRADGRVVRFHPNDVKALLATAYYWTEGGGALGGNCDAVAFDLGARCSMNPAGLVLAVANRLGLAGTSFLVDVFPSPQSQNYAVAAARLDVLRPPSPVGATPLDAALAGRVASVVDVRVTLELASTTLPLAAADELAPGGDGTRYQRVGVRGVTRGWSATLALGPGGEVLGGRWIDEPPDGPDNLAFVGSGPLLTDAGTLVGHPHLEWRVLRALAEASVDEASLAPAVDLRPDAGGGP